MAIEVFSILDATGAPLPLVTPTWYAYIDITDATPQAQPTFTSLGGADWKFTWVNPAYCGIVDCGVTAATRYLFFGPKARNAFVIYDTAYTPLTGQTPAFVGSLVTYISDGSTTTAPAISHVASGIYAFDWVGDAIIGLISCGPSSIFPTLMFSTDVESTSIRYVTGSSTTTSTFTALPNILHRGSTATIPLPVETRMILQFPSQYPVLELCRKTTLQAVTTSLDGLTKARAVLLGVCSTDLRGPFELLLDTSYDDIRVIITTARKPLLVAADLSSLSIRYPDMYQELKLLQVPEQYIDLLRTRLDSTSYLSKFSGMCGIVTLAAALILDSGA